MHHSVYSNNLPPKTLPTFGNHFPISGINPTETHTYKFFTSHQRLAGLEKSLNQLDEEFVDKKKWIMPNLFYAPYHSEAKRVFAYLQKMFIIISVHKKTTALRNILFQIEPNHM